MRLLDFNQIEEIINHRQKHSVSLFMPVFKADQRIRQNHIRLKNLIAEAEKELQKQGYRDGALTESMATLRDESSHDNFWLDQMNGVAFFLSPGKALMCRLPEQPEEQAVVRDEFYIKPLIPMITQDRLYYVLGLGQKNISLKKCTRYSVTPIELKNIPTSIEDVLKYDDPEKSMQFHTGAGGSGKRPAMFHGQGTGSDALRHKKDIKRFFQLLDNELNEKGYYKRIREQNAPLILAGIEELIPLFAEVTHYPLLTKKHIDKNPEDMDDKELLSESWDIIADSIETEKQQALDTFHELLNAQKASIDIEEIIKSAAAKRIDTLLVDPSAHIWGTYKEDKHAVTVHSDKTDSDIDLVHFSMRNTLQNDGSIRIFASDELPKNKPMAAIFRY